MGEEERGMTVAKVLVVVLATVIMFRCVTLAHDRLQEWKEKTV